MITILKDKGKIIMNEYVTKILESNRFNWPNWFSDESALRRHIDMRLGYGAIVEVESGYARGGSFPFVGSDQQFELCIFFRQDDDGWQATERVLVPKFRNDGSIHKTGDPAVSQLSSDKPRRERVTHR